MIFDNTSDRLKSYSIILACFLLLTWLVKKILRYAWFNRKIQRDVWLDPPPPLPTLPPSCKFTGLIAFIHIINKSS